MDGKKCQIVYFPYLFLKKHKSIAFLDVTIWNSKEVPSKIKDKHLRDKITKLIAQNCIRGNPIEDVGIVHIRGLGNFRPLTAGEEKKIDEVRTVLFLAGVAECNTQEGPNAGHSMLTSDNLKAIFQNFTLDSPYTGYTRGGIVQLRDFGYKISEIKWEKPYCVLENPFSCEEKFLRALERLRNRKRKFYRLILRATDPILKAYSNSEDVSHESRILEMCRAFEILFQLPEKGQRKAFKEAIKKYCEPNGARKIRYLSERSSMKKAWETESRHVMWADRFYTLRNHIIHGESIHVRRLSFRGQPHFQIALWFFLVAVKQIINEAFGERAFYDFIKVEDGKFAYDNGLWDEARNELYKGLVKQLSL